MPGMLSKLQLGLLGNAVRKFQTSAAVKNYPQFGFRDSVISKSEHAAGSMKMLYGIWWFFATPLLIAYGALVYNIEIEHMKHPRDKFIKYAHLYEVREKQLCFRDGVKNLIYHPINNATPDGYENEDPREAHGHHD